MPQYEYKCPLCNNVMEYNTAVAKRDKKKWCSICREDTMKRIVSLGTFHLKGNRWAKDGYR